MLIGRTAIGRVAITLLHINDKYRVERCEALMHPATEIRRNCWRDVRKVGS